MLESLVSSKIRRALLEYILTHHAHRFYLRGLAKELGLSVSPLRRELKRLEHLGMLRAYQEANIRFYVVDPSSPQFTQLESVALRPAASGLPPRPPAGVPASVAGPVVPSTVITLSMGLMGMVVVAGLSYLALTNQRLLALTRTAISSPRSQVTVVESAATRPTGEMRSSRWRLMPGTMGAFSTGAGEESY